MTASDNSTQLRFQPPGPGSWEQDPVHFPRPMTRYFQETQPPSFKKGTNDFARFYGMLIDGLRIGYVKGFGYNQVLPVSDDEIPERFHRAEQVFAQKLWREQLRDWDENCKPSAIAMHRELQAVDPDALSDAELVTYLTRCRDHHSAMIAQHMRFTAAAVLPTGDFLAHVGDWTGLAPSELLGLMRGSAVVSAGGSDEMERLKKAFGEDPSARKVLESDGDPAQVLASLRSLGGETGEAVSGYLNLVGNRLIDGFDIAEPSAIELPDALLRAIRIGVSGEAEAASDVNARIAEVRALVPETHQDEFDELLGEAVGDGRVRVRRPPDFANGAGDVGHRMDIEHGDVLAGEARRRAVFVNGGRPDGERRRQRGYGVPSPTSPSTRTRTPSAMRVVASRVPTTEAGRAVVPRCAPFRPNTARPTPWGFGEAVVAGLVVDVTPRAVNLLALQGELAQGRELGVVEAELVRPFAKGETVIVEGSGGAAFFIIDSGEATVSSKGVDLATLGPGDYFGEIALIDGGPRSATVKPRRRNDRRARSWHRIDPL